MFRRVTVPMPSAASRRRRQGVLAQLQADVQKLQTELQSLAAKSGLTIADLQSLTNDSQAINQAGFYFKAQSLNKAVSELATAVAGGTSTSQAQTDFTALFSGSSVSTTTINTAFSDLTKAIQDSEGRSRRLDDRGRRSGCDPGRLEEPVPGQGRRLRHGIAARPGRAPAGTTGTGTTGNGDRAVTEGHDRPAQASPCDARDSQGGRRLVHAKKLGRVEEALIAAFRS